MNGRQLVLEKILEFFSQYLLIVKEKGMSEKAEGPWFELKFGGFIADVCFVL